MLLLLGGTALAVVFVGRVIEWHAVISHTIREKIERAIADFTTWREEEQRRAEWTHHAKMTAHRFATEVRKRNAQIDGLADWARKLLDQAERWEASWFHIPWHVAHLRSRADCYVDAGYAAHDELTRIEALWAEIEAARTTDSAVANVRYLLRLLESANDAAASAALTKLYSLRNSVDWLDLAPNELPLPVRTQAAKFLRVAAGTTSSTPNVPDIAAKICFESFVPQTVIFVTKPSCPASIHMLLRPSVSERCPTVVSATIRSYTPNRSSLPSNTSS
jgi:hypothetical protein